MNSVKLISYTTPSDDLIEEGIKDIKELVSYCARVSNPDNQLNLETSKRLLSYLIKHKHWSPFEMANVCLSIETTRDIGRQILRHRSFSFQEFSQRYSSPVTDFIWREARLQDNSNRQNSIETADETISKRWNDIQTEIMTMASNHYAEAINLGIAKEVARAILPEGMVLSKMYMNGSIRSWIHYLELRLDESTQKEHRDVAKKCLEELYPLIPNIFGG